MCFARFASGLITGGCWPWSHIGPVCIPRHDGRPGGPLPLGRPRACPLPFTDRVNDTGSTCNTGYLWLPLKCGLRWIVIPRKKMTPANRTSMTVWSWLTCNGIALLQKLDTSNFLILTNSYIFLHILTYSYIFLHILHYTQNTCWSPRKAPQKNLVWRRVESAQMMSRVCLVFISQSRKIAFQQSWNKRHFLAAILSYPRWGRNRFAFESSYMGNQPMTIQLSGFCRSSSSIFKRDTVKQFLQILTNSYKFLQILTNSYKFFRIFFE